MPEAKQRLIPFIGMTVNYRLNVYTEGLILPITVKWNVTWEQYNSTTPDIFISNLTVQSTYFTVFGLVDRESAIIVENITSRQVLEVDITNTTFLQVLYDLYYSFEQPNYTPFYINTTGLKIDDHINIYNFNMTVITTDRVIVTDYGYRDVWVIKVNVTDLENVEHFISLIYDNSTGVLVGGRLYTRWFWDDGSEQIWWVEIICKYTNALTRHLITIRTNELLIIIVSCIPVFPLLVRILRIKEIEGGL